MNNTDTMAEAIGSIIVINTAITNMRLYPSTSAMIKNTVERVFQSFERIFRQDDAVSYAESEKQLLVCGQSLSESEMKKPQAISFLEMMLNFSVKSLEFKKGLKTGELLAFLEIMSKKPEEIEIRGGLEKVFTENNLQNIILDQKVYVAFDKDRQLLAGIELKDEEIVQYLTGQSKFDNIDPKEIQKLSNDPEWIARIFQTGMQGQKTEKGGKGGSLDLPETAIRLIESLEAITDKTSREKITENISITIADMDEDLIGKLLLKNLDTLLDGGLLNHIIAKLDDDKFEALALNIKHQAGQSVARNDGTGDPINEKIHNTFQMMMNSEKGKRLEEKIHKKIEQEKMQTKEWFSHLKSGLSKILKGEKEPFLDETLINKLPKAVDQLFSNNKAKTAESIIERAIEALQEKNPGINNSASQAVCDIFEKLFQKNRLDVVLATSHKLIPWVKSNSSITSSYRLIFEQLKILAQKLIHKKRFSDCNHILETFNLIAGGRLKKDTATLNLSGQILEELSREAEIKIFLEHLKTDDKKRKKQITYSLAMLGSPAVESLLDILRNSQDAYERGDILYVLSKIGHLEISAIVDRLKKDEPWYYIRNLTLLIGRVGTRDHLPILKRFLEYDDFRVKDEVLTGIFNIGGVEGKQYIFSILPSIEDPLKIKIITKIGEMALTEAAPVLLEMLQVKSQVHTGQRDEIEEKICHTLGNIGSRKAIPILKEIAAGQKGLLQRKSHGESVKEAARKAIESLNSQFSEKISA